MNREQIEGVNWKEAEKAPSQAAADFDRAMEMLTGMMAETVESRRVAGAVSETTADWFTPHYLLALRGQMAERTDSQDRFKLMRKAARDVAAFQRGGLLSARLQLDREKLAHKRDLAKSHEPGARRDFNQPMTDEELKACVDKVDEIMGLKNASPETEAQLERVRKMG